MRLRDAPSHIMGNAGPVGTVNGHSGATSGRGRSVAEGAASTGEGRRWTVRGVVVSAHGGPEVLTSVELPDPEPAPGELLVEVAVAGVNFIDTHRREGTIWPARSAGSRAASV